MPGVAGALVALGVARAARHAPVPEDVHHGKGPRTRDALRFGHAERGLELAAPAQLVPHLERGTALQPVVAELLHLVRVIGHLDELHLDLGALAALCPQREQPLDVGVHDVPVAADARGLVGGLGEAVDADDDQVNPLSRSDAATGSVRSRPLVLTLRDSRPTDLP